MGAGVGEGDSNYIAMCVTRVCFAVCGEGHLMMSLCIMVMLIKIRKGLIEVEGELDCSL